jgi:hypothetical protein
MGISQVVLSLVISRIGGPLLVGSSWRGPNQTACRALGGTTTKAKRFDVEEDA